MGNVTTQQVQSMVNTAIAAALDPIKQQLATLATTVSVQALAARVSAIEGRLATFATASDVQALVADVTVLKAEVAALMTPAPASEPAPEPQPVTVATDLASTVTKDSDLRSNPDVLAYVEFSDIDTVNADLGRSNWEDRLQFGSSRAWYAISALVSDVGTHKAGESFCVSDPEFSVDRGLPFMRFSGTQRLIAADLFAGQGIRHAFCRYVLYIEPDVMQFITDGVKLPGLAGEYEDTILHPPHAGTQTFSWRMEHGPKVPSVTDRDARTQPPLSWRDYLYDGASGGGFGNIKYYGGAFPVGVPIVIEQELDVDAKHGRVWLNDVMIGERDVITDIDIEMLFLNVYHGGTGFATAPIHYRLAGACIAKSRIGVPIELRDGTLWVPTVSAPVTPVTTVPATPATNWRQGLVVGQWTEIPGTSIAKVAPVANIDAWCGLAVIDDAAAGLALWVSAAAGGHVDSSDNGVYGLDWTKDVPGWVVMCPPSAVADRITVLESQAADGTVLAGSPYNHDGLPNSSHTYWSLVWCAQRGLIFRPFAQALWHDAQRTNKMDGFNPATGKWDAAGTWPDCPILETQALVAVDPATGDIYCGSTSDSNLIYRWAQVPNTWGRVGISGSFGYAGYHGGVVDRIRKRLVRGGLTSDGEFLSQIPVLDLATGAASIIASGITDAPAGPRSITHDYDKNAFYLTDSANVYRLDGASLQGTKLGPLPAGPVNGVLGRWAYFSARKIVAFYPSGSGNCWVMPTA